MTKGYHVQITARSERDLTPEGIMQKVSDASGSKYSAGALTENNGPPPVSSKPAFMPTRSSGGAGGFNPLAKSKLRSSAPKDVDVDEDGWGQDAPQVTRTQLEKVQSSYQPTKINMRELTSQKPEPSRFNVANHNERIGNPDVVRGTYQPVGKVDVAALRREAQEAGKVNDDRPTVVKGSYEPVGKVDIAAIRARAQKPGEVDNSNPSSISPSTAGVSTRESDHTNDRTLLSDRAAPFSAPERLTSMPKPKVGNRFGAGTSAFTGTKAPIPSGFESNSQKGPVAPPIGVGRTFADEGGKTPAQIWAEKKARERGLGGVAESKPPLGSGGAGSPVGLQKSGGGEWKSGYEGKSWAPVQTTRTGQSQGSLSQQRTGEDDQDDAQMSPEGGVGAIRDRFKGAPAMGFGSADGSRKAPSPPPLDTTSKPNTSHGVPLPGLPIRMPQKSYEKEDEGQETTRMPSPPHQPPRSPTPPTPPAVDTGSPIRVAMPVSRGHEAEVENARSEQYSPPPPMPTRSLAQAIPHEDELTDEPVGHDPARGAGEAAAAVSFGDRAVEPTHPSGDETGTRALVQYDYEKAEENELELKEGEYVINIQMVDDDWWMGQNTHGDTGLFPSNYVELVAGDSHTRKSNAQIPDDKPQATGHPIAAEASSGATATALYDYEAAEGNELSFPEDAKITDVVSASLILLLAATKCITRNFPMRTGGLDHMEESKDFFQRIMSA